MKRLRVFRYLPEVDAFEVTSEYRELAELLGMNEWNPVTRIGRLFTLDNDRGEHWFDNWDELEARRSAAERHALDADTLLAIDPERFIDGTDGPCHSPEVRRRFWHDVLCSLELSAELLFEKARELNNERERRSPTDPEGRDTAIVDLEARMAEWSRKHRR